MIKEAYCSFEVAKLLKEKGFNEKCSRWYVANEPQEGIVENGFGENQFYINAPTHQLAMKWLREVHNLHIWIDYSGFDFNSNLPYLWNIRETKIDGNYWGGTFYKTYEVAVEAALKYVLENLI